MPDEPQTQSYGLLSSLAEYISPSNKEWAPWPIRTLRSGLAALAAPGDAFAGRLPMIDSSGHTSLEAIGRASDLAGLMMLGATGAPSGALGSGFVRRTARDTPYNDVGHMMFVDEAKSHSINSYGKNLWGFESNDVPFSAIVDAGDSSFRRNAYRALRNEYDAATSRALVDEANPSRIVNSAGTWDDLNAVQVLWDKYFEPRGIAAVTTRDGAVLFDPKYARKIETD